jgi:hypothetical protein
VRYEAGILTLSDLVTNWRDVRGRGVTLPAPGALFGNASVGVIPRKDMAVSPGQWQLDTLLSKAETE